MPSTDLSSHKFTNGGSPQAEDRSLMAYQQITSSCNQKGILALKQSPSW